MDRIFVQLATTVIILAIIIVQALWIRRCTNPVKRKERLFYAIPILTWMTHGLIFYVMVILSRLVVDLHSFIESFGGWSSILRMHGLITVLALEIARYQTEREDTIYHE